MSEVPQSIGLLKKLVMASVVACAAFVALEASVWVVALAANRDWRADPLPAHSPFDVVCKHSDGSLYLCPEAVYGYERVRPESFGVESSRSRVVVVGESFVFGLGLDSGQAWPAALEERLGGEAEVLNFGRCGFYASRLLPVVDAAIALAPDVLVLSVGNNEHTMTSFYTGWPARHPAAFYELSARLGSLQTYGLLVRLAGGDPVPNQVFDAPSDLEDPVELAAYSARRRPPDLTAFPDGIASVEVTELIEREQRLKEQIFEDLLTRMVTKAQDAGIEVVLTTLPREHRTPPVLSGLHTGDPKAMRQLIASLASAGGDEAEATFAAALAEDSRVSAVHQMRAEWLLSRGDRIGAADSFRQAAEWDLVPDSTPGLNAVVRGVAADTDSALVDLADLFDVQLEKDRNLFLDRVHVSAEGADYVADSLEPVVRPLFSE